MYPQLPGFQPPLAYQFHQVAGPQPPYRGQSLAGCAPTNQGHTVAGSPPNYQHQLSPYYQQQSPYHHQLPQGAALYQPNSGFQPPLAYQFHHMAGSPPLNQVQQVSGVPPTHQGQQVAGAPPTYQVQQVAGKRGGKKQKWVFKVTQAEGLHTLFSPAFRGAAEK